MAPTAVRVPSSPPPAPPRPPPPSTIPPEVEVALADPDRRFGRYALLDELGRGGMGVVWRGYDLDLRRYVAIKHIIRCEEGAEVDRFVREARTCARLRHEGIVAIHESGRHDDRPYLVLDFIEGRTLEQVLANEEPSPRRIATLVREVALGLEHAHQHGVVHRDVKPQNVLVGRDGRARLTDFGLARDLQGASLTHSGQVMGTPSYMAPEQANGERAAQGPATDVWALGAVLHRALAGRPPFRASDQIALIVKILRDDPEPLRSVDPRIHRDLETIARRCLEKTPERRYRSAGEVADELGRFVEGEAIHARPPGLVERMGRTVRRRRAIVASIAAASIAGLGAVLVSIAMLRSERATRRAELEERVRSTRAAFDGAAASEPGAALVRGLEALEASGRLLADTDAGEQLQLGSQRFDTATKLAELASREGRWDLASFALQVARDCPGGDRAIVEAASERLDEARHASERRRAVAVTELLRAAAAGELERAEPYQDALFDLVALAAPATEAQLVATLDELTDVITAADADLLASVTEPDAKERGLGQGAIDELPAALDWLRVRPLERTEPSPGIESALRLARRRLGDRLQQRSDLDDPQADRETAALHGLAAAEREALGRRIDLSRLCCDALGRVGSPAASPAVANHLVASHDLAPAIVAGRALARIGGELSAQVLADERERRGANGPFWTRVRGILEGSSVETDLDRGAGEDRLERAMLRLDRGDLAGAREDADAAVIDAPDSAKAIGMRGLVRWKQGDLEGALADVDRAIELEPALATSWATRAGIRLIRDDVPGAIDDFAEAIRRDPEGAGSHNNRGEALARIGRFEEALADLDRALELRPDLGAALVNRASVRLSLGDVAGAEADHDRAIAVEPDLALAWCARAVFRRARGDPTGALLDLDRAIQIAPDDIASRTERAAVRRLGGDVAGAVEDWRRVVETDPGRVGALQNLGGALYELGRPDEALRVLDRALALAPDDVGARSNRGAVLLGLGELDRAIAELDLVVKLAPEHAAGWSNRGAAREEAGDIEGALADYGRAIELDRASARSWLNRATLRERMKDIRGAIEDYDGALRAVPRSLEALTGRGLARRMLGDVRGALSDLEEAIRHHPRSGIARMNHGLLLHATGAPAAEVLADLDAALDLDGPSAIAYVNRGSVRRDLGELDEALADLDRAIALDPIPEALHERGLVRALRGELELARTDLTRCLSLRPGNGIVRLVLVGIGGDAEIVAGLERGHDWGNLLAGHLLGRVSAADLLAAARAQGDPERVAVGLAQGHAYAGMAAERAGDSARAREHYEAAIASGARGRLFELAWARSRLGRLHQR